MQWWYLFSTMSYASPEKSKKPNNWTAFVWIQKSAPRKISSELIFVHRWMVELGSVMKVKPGVTRGPLCPLFTFNQDHVDHAVNSVDELMHSHVMSSQLTKLTHGHVMLFSRWRTQSIPLACVVLIFDKNFVYFSKKETTNNCIFDVVCFHLYTKTNFHFGHRCFIKTLLFPPLPLSSVPI